MPDYNKQLIYSMNNIFQDENYYNHITTTPTYVLYSCFQVSVSNLLLFESK